jgi:hypothetical protein
MNYPDNSSPDAYDEWFESERGTELDDDDMPDFDDMSSKDYE